MEIIVLDTFEKVDDTLKARYFLENHPDDVGYIKISRDNSVLDCQKIKVDNGSDKYFKTAKSILSQTFSFEPLPIKTLVSA